MGSWWHAARALRKHRLALWRVRLVIYARLMREPRRFARAFCLAALAAVLPISLAACSGGGAGYPDRDAVVSAQAAWCTALGKLEGSGEKWSGMSSCKSAYPTASAAFLRGLTKCYVARREAAGTRRPTTPRSSPTAPTT